MKKSLKAVIIVLIIMANVSVLAVGCSSEKDKMIRDDFNTITFYFNNGYDITFNRGDVIIQEGEELIVVDQYYWNNGGQRYCYRKEDIKKIRYT